MTIINANTKIGVILKQHPQALDAIVSISPKFEKLRNPVLRKLMAGRTSIAMASKIGGCSIKDFFDKLAPLGFRTKDINVTEEKETDHTIPGYLRDIHPDKIVKLDVRPVLEKGEDPLNLILNSIKNLQPGYVLEISNSFVPTPLILLLKKRGFESYINEKDENLVETYFYKTTGSLPIETAKKENSAEGWDEILQRYKGKLQTADVRQLEMPLPMMTILEKLEHLPEHEALFVYHKRIPVFLLPELTERKFDYRIKEIGDAEVHLLIFRP